MEIYCLKCRTKTETTDLKSVVLKNNVPAVRGRCSKCGTVKYLITGRRSGGSIVNTLLNKLPLPEMHLGLPKAIPSENRPNGSFNNSAKYSYCGPFTKLRPRLNQGYRGVNKLDEACLEHDIAYAASNEVKDRNKADDVLANKAAQLVMDNRTPDYEKQDGRLVTGIIATKSRFGM
jgi:hypothetical protein